MSASCNKHHLMWIRDRLIHVYDESPLLDYMHKLQAIIDVQESCRRKKEKCELYYLYEEKPNDRSSNRSSSHRRSGVHHAD